MEAEVTEEKSHSTGLNGAKQEQNIQELQEKARERARSRARAIARASKSRSRSKSKSKSKQEQAGVIWPT